MSFTANTWMQYDGLLRLRKKAVLQKIKDLFSGPEGRITTEKEVCAFLSMFPTWDGLTFSFSPTAGVKNETAESFLRTLRDVKFCHGQDFAFRKVAD